MRLKGKTAIVTGGGQGLGEGIALRFAREGANVAIVDKNPETTPAVVGRIEQAGGTAIPIVADLYQVSNIERAVETTLRKFGRIDILVASAGIFNVASIEDTTEEMSLEGCPPGSLTGSYVTVEAGKPSVPFGVGSW